MSNRDREVRYVVQYVIDTPGRMWTPGEWRARSHHQVQADGKPTTANLKEHCLTYEASTQPGACNAHLGATKILSAKIIDQRDMSVVATYTRGS